MDLPCLFALLVSVTLSYAPIVHVASANEHDGAVDPMVDPMVGGDVGVGLGMPECDMCVDLVLSQPDPMVEASFEAIGLTTDSRICGIGSYDNNVTTGCSVNLCGRGTIEVKLVPPTGQQVIVKMTSRSCYEMFGEDAIPAGGCTSYNDLPGELQAAVIQDIQYFEMFGMAADLMSAEFCACDTPRCNGNVIDSMIEELQLTGGAGVVSPLHPQVAALICSSVLVLKLFLVI